MRKHPGLISRCRPSVDRLEERALLSGGIPGPGPIFAPPMPPPVHSQPPSLGNLEPDQRQTYQDARALSPVDSWSSQPQSWAEPYLIGASSTQPTGAGPTPSVSDVDSPSQAAGGLAFLLIVGPAIPSGSLSQGRVDPAPGVGTPSNLGSTPGSIVTSLAQDAPGASDPAGVVAVDAPAAGSMVMVGEDLGAENVGVVNLSLAPAANSPPAQLLSLLDPGNGVATHLLSPREASPPDNSLLSKGAGQWPLIAVGASGSPSTGRTRTPGTSEAATGHHDRGLEELLGPTSADLLASALPFDRAAIEQAIDRFFQEYEDLNPRALIGPRPVKTLLYALALASTAAGLDVARRRWTHFKTGKNVRVRRPLALTEPVGFPQLPGSWSSRLS